MRDHKGLGWGVALFCFGVVLLLVNLNVIEWSVFRSFWVLWPLLLVIAGVSVLARHRHWVVIIAWVVFFAVLVVYGYYYSQPQTRAARLGFSPRTLIAEAENGIDAAVLKFDLDAGDVDIAGGGDALAEVDTSDRRLYLNTRVSGGTETVEVRAGSVHFPFINIGGLRTSIALEGDIPWEIEIDSDAANTRIDMEDLAVSSLTYEGDATNIRLELGDNVPLCRISVRSDLSHITIVVPDNVGVRYSIDGDIRHVNSDDVKFIQEGGWQETEGYDTAAARVEIDLKTDLGFVTFKR